MAHRFIRAYPLMTAAAIAIAAVASYAQPSISLNTCTKISKAGLYEIDATSGLNSSGGDCIVISASNVILYLNGSPIIGGGTGAGVHVVESASDAFVEGRDAVISGFAEGIEIDGSKDLAENFTTLNNTDAGVLLNNAKQAKLSNFTADSNATDGVRIYKGSYNTVAGGIDAWWNGRYGVWLSSTSHNNVGGFDVRDNSTAGVYIGCSVSGPSGSKCKVPSKYNSIFNGAVNAVTLDSQPYGVVIDLGNDFNRVTNMNSGTPFETKGDLVDENANCANNDWFGEQQIFYTQPPSPGGCIP